jgi:hypothetical protein
MAGTKVMSSTSPESILEYREHVLDDIHIASREGYFHTFITSRQIRTSKLRVEQHAQRNAAIVVMTVNEGEQLMQKK